MEITEKQLHELINKKARTVVGILCTRIEVLEEEEKLRQRKNPNAKILTPRLYKSLAKEIIYEQFRNLEEVLQILTLPTVKFRNRESR